MLKVEIKIHQRERVTGGGQVPFTHQRRQVIPAHLIAGIDFTGNQRVVAFVGRRERVELYFVQLNLGVISFKVFVTHQHGARLIEGLHLKSASAYRVVFNP